MSEVTAELTWTEGVAFSARTGEHELQIDGDAAAGPSPMQQLGLGVAGCMGIDVVHILTKMRTAPEALGVRMRGERAEEEPRRFVKIELTFVLTGDIPQANVDRAIRLSRERYCSAWASIRQDVELVVTTEIIPPPPA